MIQHDRPLTEQGNGKDRERQRITVFPEDANPFLAAITEMIGRL